MRGVQQPEFPEGDFLSKEGDFCRSRELRQLQNSHHHAIMVHITFDYQNGKILPIIIQNIDFDCNIYIHRYCVPMRSSALSVIGYSCRDGPFTGLGRNHNSRHRVPREKVHQHTEGKWLIYGTKHRKDNQLQIPEPPSRISKLRIKVLTKGQRW